MRALEIITGHVIYNPAYTYKFQLKTTYYSIALRHRIIDSVYKTKLKHYVSVEEFLATVSKALFLRVRSVW